MNQDGLSQLSERVYALLGSVNSAVVLNDAGEALLFDSGGDKDAGRRIRGACERLGVRPVAVINSHAHADHYGGNDYLVRQFGLRVYAPEIEASLMAAPYLEPVYLCGGAKPLPELLGKWLLAKPSPPDALLGPGRLSLHGLEAGLLDTSGHAHRQLSLLVDGVLLAADALFGASALARYPLPFGQDIGRQIASAETLRGAAATVALPGHGDPETDLEALVDLNLAAFARAAAAVEAACEGCSADEVLARSCDALGVLMSDLPRYHLNRTVVAAYLSYLRESGRVELRLEGNRLLWRRLGG